MFNMAMLYLNDQAENEWHTEALSMVQKADSLGNVQAKEYLRQFNQKHRLQKPELLKSFEKSNNDELKQTYLTDEPGFGLTFKDKQLSGTLSDPDNDLSYTKTALNNMIPKLSDNRSDISQQKVAPVRPHRLKKQNSVNSGKSGNSGSGGKRGGSQQPDKKLGSLVGSIDNSDINDRVSSRTGSDVDIFS